MRWSYDHAAQAATPGEARRIEGRIAALRAQLNPVAVEGAKLMDGSPAPAPPPPPEDGAEAARGSSLAGSSRRRTRTARR